MSAFQRVKEELLQLQEKISKLENFMQTAKYESLDKDMRYYMYRQLLAMRDYERCLKARILLWRAEDLEDGEKLPVQ